MAVILEGSHSSQIETSMKKWDNQRAPNYYDMSHLMISAVFEPPWVSDTASHILAHLITIAMR